MVFHGGRLVIDDDHEFAVSVGVLEIGDGVDHHLLFDVFEFGRSPYVFHLDEDSKPWETEVGPVTAVPEFRQCVLVDDVIED